MKDEGCRTVVGEYIRRTLKLELVQLIKSEENNKD
jgi:hypothetical protein